jgi:hypothetical protein
VGGGSQLSHTPLPPDISHGLSQISQNESPHHSAPISGMAISGMGMEWAGPASVLGLSPLNGTASLRQINVGFGTTGTRSLFSKDSNSGTFASGCHYFVCFGGGLNYDLPNLFYKMALCVSNPRHGQHWGTERCRTEPWLAELKKLLLASFSRKEVGGAGLELYSDTPAAYLFSEVLNLVPGATVQHSLRDPFMWVLKRIEEHDDDVMCAPGSMTPQHELDGGAMHILPCLLGTEFLYEKLVNLRQYVGANPPNIAQYLKGHDEVSIMPTAQELASATRPGEGTPSATGGEDLCLMYHNNRHNYTPYTD